MRLATPLAAAVLASIVAPPARATTPADFQGRWVVSRMVGASDVSGSAADYHALLGTKLVWTNTTVTSADGVCQIVRARITPVSNDTLQHSLWGGQTIKGLTLPKNEIATAFGKEETPVYEDGGKGCATGAVLLDRDHLLFMFDNGYLYVLERLKR